MVKEKDTVSLHYTGYDRKDKVFDTTVGEGPIEVPLGMGYMIPGIEDALIGMNEGDKKTLTLEPEEAYGLIDNDLIIQVDRSSLPSGLEIKRGVTVMSENEDGSELPLTIKSVRGETVTLDANHPMAGERVKFDIQLIKIH
ncbi:MAG: FKBP-type peptidyl-prolyl cis-trans isomerase [Schleiferiaceae bacterium]|jgi:FKBP-type peptidyl-prolyl cis-trans isomerase 2|nr:FKBP-type peptidyl-prolyl cis-trans isomerase [Schleiferiaceae bacterium]